MKVPDVVSKDGDFAEDIERVGLTDDELLILSQLAQGNTADRVGRSLDVSGRTVRRRRRAAGGSGAFPRPPGPGLSRDGPESRRGTVTCSPSPGSAGRAGMPAAGAAS